QLADWPVRIVGHDPAPAQIARVHDDAAAGLALDDIGAGADARERQRDRRAAVDDRVLAAEDKLCDGASEGVTGRGAGVRGCWGEIVIRIIPIEVAAAASVPSSLTSTKVLCFTSSILALGLSSANI